MMKSNFAFATLFVPLLFVNSINARPGINEYWRNVMKDQPMPEAIKGLVHDQDSVSNADVHCETTEDSKKVAAEVKDNLFKKVLESGNNMVLNGKQGKFKRDFDQVMIPFIIYDDLKNKRETSFAKDLESGNNMVLNGKQGKFKRDFDQVMIPFIIYDDLKNKRETSFAKDLESGNNMVVNDKEDSFDRAFESGKNGALSGNDDLKNKPNFARDLVGKE